MSIKLLALLALSGYAMTAESAVVVIVNAKSPISHLTREQVADIFLGRTGAFPNGLKATPVEYLESSPQYVEFHLHVTEKNAIQLKAYWSKMVFSGQAIPPITAAPEKIFELLRKNQSVITYTDRANVVDGAFKIVFPTDDDKK